VVQSEEDLFDLIRKERVAATPEERIRQKLLYRMVQELGYPPSLIVVEKRLSQLPHLASMSSTLPLRRLDILCFAQGIHPSHPLYPLLMVECKEHWTQEAIHQVVGYNHYVGAFFVAVADKQEVQLGWREKDKGYQFEKGLPPFQMLLQVVTGLKN
jgi:hypothetical protein